MSERLCYGAQQADGSPDCDGPDVQTVHVVSPIEGQEFAEFTTRWCSECRRIATTEQGCTILEVHDATPS